MYLEPHPQGAGAPERLNGEGVERARPGAGVDLRLDGGDVEICQAHPFAPAYPQHLARVSTLVRHDAERLFCTEVHSKALKAVLPMGSLASAAPDLHYARAPSAGRGRGQTMGK